MKRVAIVGPGQAVLIDAPDPEPFDDWVVVRVDVAPMCTEYKRFQDGDVTGVLGHEAAGVVVAVAREGRVAVGDRVVAMPLLGCGTCRLCTDGDYIHCESRAELQRRPEVQTGNATYAQYIVKQDWLLMPIPDGVPTQLASLACCGIGPTFGAMDILEVDASTTLLVTGAGPVGLGAVVNATHRGARVVVVESIPYRAALARQLGAAVVVDPSDSDVLERVRSACGGAGADAAIDCSGNVRAERLCIDASRRKGRVCFVGECHDDLVLRASPDLIGKGLTLSGAWHYNLKSYDRVMAVIEGSPSIASLITHTFPMSEAQTALELSASRQSGKILLDPWG